MNNCQLTKKNWKINKLSKRIKFNRVRHRTGEHGNILKSKQPFPIYSKMHWMITLCKFPAGFSPIKFVWHMALMFRTWHQCEAFAGICCRCSSIEWQQTVPCAMQVAFRNGLHINEMRGLTLYAIHIVHLNWSWLDLSRSFPFWCWVLSTTVFQVAG